MKRVIGGHYSHKGQWPWLVSLQANIITRRFMGIIPSRFASVYCGGALISEKWVLTAAHCFIPDGRKVPVGANYPSNWKVRLGTVDLAPDFRDRFMHTLGRLLKIKSWLQTERRIRLIAIHPLYNSNLNWKNDIALIKLDRPVVGHPHIKSISIPLQDQGFPIVGDTCIAKGWGCHSHGGRVSNNMKHANLTVYDQLKCTRLYRTGMRTRVCAGFSGNSICQGDSGGPLVCKQNGRWVHAGIASFTHLQSPLHYPSVFTKTASYSYWINAIIKRY